MEVVEEQEEKIEVSEDLNAEALQALSNQRLSWLRELDEGEKLFQRSNFVRSRGAKVTLEDVELLRKFFSSVVSRLNLDLTAYFWNQYFKSREIGRRLTILLGLKIDANKFMFQLELLCLTRALSKLFYKHEYRILNYISETSGIPLPCLEGYTLSLNKIAVVTEAVALDRASHDDLYADFQDWVFEDLYRSLSHDQKLTWFAVIAGQDIWSHSEASQQFCESDQISGITYNKLGVATSASNALLALEANVLYRTSEWLKEQGVNVGVLVEEIERFKPRFVIVGRHGNIEIPILRVVSLKQGEEERQRTFYRWYTRDSAMHPDHWVHLNKVGKSQYERLGALLEDNGFYCSDVWVSPETRAIESGKCVAERFGVELRPEPLIDEALAPGYYERDIHIQPPSHEYHDYQQFSPFWRDLGHEQIESIIDRMLKGFRKAVVTLRPGQARLLVSHGDPATLLLHTLVYGYKPPWYSIYEKISFQKGDAMVFVCNGETEIFTAYSLRKTPAGSN